jgi:hypothetical protein
VLACGEWRLLAGPLSSVLAQAAVVWVVLGSTAFTAFAGNIPTTIAYADLLEAKPFMSHSLRALTRLTPNWIGLPLWAILAAIVLWYTVRMWKSRAPVRVKLGTVVLASVLVNPHLIIYDLTVLALPLRWFGAYMQEPVRRERAASYWMAVYWLFAVTFVPTAAAVGLQASVFVMLGLLALVSRAVQGESSLVAPVDTEARLTAHA